MRNLDPEIFEVKVAVTPYRKLYFFPVSILYSEAHNDKRDIELATELGNNFPKLFRYQTEKSFIFQNLNETTLKDIVSKYNMKIYYSYYNEPRLEEKEFRQVNKMLDVWPD